MNLNEVKWNEFFINDIFIEIQRGKRIKSCNHIKGDVPYISSTGMNNGVDAFIGNKEKVRIFNNCLTLANSGSVGSCFYQSFRFVASDHVTKLVNPEFNKYVYLFISTMLLRLSEKYSFNREISDSRIQREKVLLPVNDEGSPDYEFMNNYMRGKEIELKERYKSYMVNHD